MLTVWIAKGWFGRWRLYARASGKSKWLGTFPTPEMARHAQMGFVIEAKQKGATCKTV
jgi:hypothetical protein